MRQYEWAVLIMFLLALVSMYGLRILLEGIREDLRKLVAIADDVGSAKKSIEEIRDYVRLKTDEHLDAQIEKTLGTAR